MAAEEVNEEVQETHEEVQETLEEAQEMRLDTIKVSNLDWNITEEKLQEYFSQYGNVLTSKIPKRHKGGSKGFGFVTFETEPAAKTAVDQMNNAPIEGRRIGVVFATSEEKSKKPKEEPKAAVEQAEIPASARLHVRELAWEVKQEDLNEAFGEYGELLSAQVVTNPRTGRSKGYGFLEYKTVEQATAAKEAMDKQEIKERPINVFYAKSKGPTPKKKASEDPRAESKKKKRKPRRKKKAAAQHDEDEEEEEEAPKKKRGRRNRKKEASPAQDEPKLEPKRTPKKPKPKVRLYVKVSPEATKEAIEEAFAEYGEVKKVNISKHKETGEPKGVAFVSFVTEEAAAAAKEGASSKELHGQAIEVDFVKNYKTRRPGKKRA